MRWAIQTGIGECDIALGPAHGLTDRDQAAYFGFQFSLVSTSADSRAVVVLLRRLAKINMNWIQFANRLTSDASLVHAVMQLGSVLLLTFMAY